MNKEQSYRFATIINSGRLQYILDQCDLYDNCEFRKYELGPDPLSTTASEYDKEMRGIEQDAGLRPFDMAFFDVKDGSPVSQCAIVAYRRVGEGKDGFIEEFAQAHVDMDQDVFPVTFELLTSNCLFAFEMGSDEPIGWIDYYYSHLDDVLSRGDIIHDCLDADNIEDGFLFDLLQKAAFGILNFPKELEDIRKIEIQEYLENHGIYLNERGILMIRRVYVKPEFRRKGVLKAMYQCMTRYTSNDFEAYVYEDATTERPSYNLQLSDQKQVAAALGFVSSEGTVDVGDLGLNNNREMVPVHYDFKVAMKYDTEVESAIRETIQYVKSRN